MKMANVPHEFVILSGAKNLLFFRLSKYWRLPFAD
jgi:hypothetical protein